MSERKQPVLAPPKWDEGTASERTVLSWQRTAIATLGIAVLVLRAGIVERLLVLAIPLAATLTIAACTEWLLSLHIYAEHNRPFALGAILHDRAIAALGLVTVIAATGSAGLALSA
jgi:uncharacterized membrane protein YidH (DUF202 family)